MLIVRYRGESWLDNVNPIACPRCGAANKADARFCTVCGNQLSPMTQPSPTLAPAPGAPFPSTQTGYSADYASAMAEHDKTQSINRTKTGLLLLIIGLLIGPIPFVGIIGVILDLIGAILVIIGRKPFGPAHSRNTIWSVVIYSVGIAVVIIGSVAFTLSVISASFNPSVNGAFDQNTVGQALASSFDGLLIAAAIGGAVIGIANVLFTYAIQNKNGRTLLWSAYIASLAVSVVTILVIGPLITNAFQQAVSGGRYDPGPISALQLQESIIGLLGYIPALIYAVAFYSVVSRINRREIPAIAAQIPI